jgi:hypothetical protein
VTYASHVPEDSIVKMNIAARNVDSLLAASTDITKIICYACNDCALRADTDEVECSLVVLLSLGNTRQLECRPWR